MEWIEIEDLNDNDEIYPGACVRFLNTPKGISEYCTLPTGLDGHLDYIISYIYGNHEYYQLTCLTMGEGGNITCVLKRDNGNTHITGKELKTYVTYGLI